MLLHIPQIFSPELLKILMEMGHNDELVISDGNFPQFAYPEKVIYCTATGTVNMLDAVVRFFPLDNGPEEPVIHMAVGQEDTYTPVTWPQYDEILKKYGYNPLRKKYLPKNEFYPRSKKAYAVVVTGEPAFYATVILKKGTVPDQMDILNKPV
jgi:L-fucose mutarotase